MSAQTAGGSGAQTRATASVLQYMPTAAAKTAYTLTDGIVLIEVSLEDLICNHSILRPSELFPLCEMSVADDRLQVDLGTDLIAHTQRAILVPDE